ncbi:MAG: hypothetical protein NTV05_11685 [Acidobacteria bacterium]|nr:hypothetical protein [Acidobacteriota bacterium]
MPRRLEIHFAHSTLRGCARVNEPVTLSVPLSKGLCVDTNQWTLSGTDGVPLALQTRVLNRWSDGSVRWALLDFQATADESTNLLAVLELDRGGTELAGPKIAIAVSAEALVVDTGAVVFHLGPDAPCLFRSVIAATSSVIDGSGSRLRVLAADGAPCDVKWRPPTVEEQGQLRTVVRFGGAVTGKRLRLELVARLHFFAGSAAVRIQLTVRNPRRARHRGGFWELGDSGSVLLKELTLVLRRAAAASRLQCSLEPGTPPLTTERRIEVYQDSSGGDSWQSPNHVNREGRIPCRFRGYRAMADGRAIEGLRATPVVVTQGEERFLAACVPEFWQNFPRAVSATTAGIRVSFWPSEWADVHELQGGEQKTHEVWLAFGPDPVTDLPLDWSRSRLLVHASPEWYAASGAVPYLTPAASDPHTNYLALVNAAIEGDDTFLRKRERIDEYGWRNFGDLYADHEAVNAPAGHSFVSHYNNQYDVVGGFAVQFLRSAAPRWWTQMDELARHVVDIDIYHTDEDKSAYNHGLFWHTAHYLDAGRATHRTYARTGGTNGGGPSNEHDYTTGLLYHHFLTGDTLSRDAVLELARWVIDMDDGRRTVFRWLDRGNTGLASSTGSTTYHGPGRGSANSILTLLNAHTLTGNNQYIAKAEELIRRCIHPASDIATLDLLDAERKWFYTVFLQALGRYLHYKAERAELDSSYAYARASLLHFARWMAANEYPYLDKPEILEYPNETWAAQDMRKSEVFMHAALHAGGDERQRFEARAGFFFDYSTRALLSMSSHVLTRPTVLMLTNGYMRAWFTGHPETRMPEAAQPLPDFEPPGIFVPQRVRAERRAIFAAVAACLLALAAVVALFVR